MRRKILAALAAMMLAAPVAPLPAQSPLEAEGAAAMGVALRRLGTTKRVLMIAAHPDDENTAVIAELALGEGADVAYLSLTRGEGGQNLIGPELQEGLGLIRSEELLAARRLDGARQFFTRAYDYGFSKSADEAFRQWPKDTLLADVVEVVRRYRPDVIIAVFSGTPADGHGQHQASGILAREAFTAAADPARFSDQLARGLRAHRARYLFQAPYRPGPNVTFQLPTGNLDPLFARSHYQIAMQSRSRHRSQDMGRAEPVGPQATSFVALTGDHPGVASLFAAVDTTLSQRARTAGASAAIVQAFAQYENVTTTLRAQYNPLRLHDLAAPLANALTHLRSITLPNSTAFEELRFALHHEIADAADAVRQAAGIVVDVVADTRHPVAGTTFGLTISLWNGGRADVKLGALTPLLPAGWTFDAAQTEAAADGPGVNGVLARNAVVRRRFTVRVPQNAMPTEAYFLLAPRTGAMYRWRAADTVRALPFDPPAIRASVAVDPGAPITIEREAEYVDVDKALGEVRRPLLVVPRVAVSVEPRHVVIPAGDVAPRPINVTVASAAPVGEPGTLRLIAPTGWRVQPASVPMQLTRAGETRTLEFVLTPPANVSGQTTLRAVYETAGGAYDRGYSLIQYPHIRPRPLYRPAELRVTSVAVQVVPDLRIGYIEGAGDDGAAALKQLGARVETIDAATLAAGDLSRFNVIVAGIRAYEVRADLLAHNDRVLEYVRNGGTYIVQYNKYELVDGGFMPYPAVMARPHGRVTDENAAVTLLQPDHPLLSYPNRITATDFEGWVQERGLYYLERWDDRYTPLLEMADPGEAPQRGSLVATRVGNGWYVYTGLSLFRQLPEGVPGAYRLLANLVSLARAPLRP